MQSGFGFFTFKLRHFLKNKQNDLIKKTWKTKLGKEFVSASNPKI